jgi:hypothetical protein
LRGPHVKIGAMRMLCPPADLGACRALTADA